MAEKKTYKRMIFGDWETLHEIGSGNFGEAHKARHRTAGKLAVIKFLKMDPLKDVNNEYETHFKTLVSELKTLKEFDSPFINKVYDWDLRADKPWLALQFFHGATVAEQVSQNGPLDEKNWWKLAHDLLTALQYIHSKGKVHRDLNPKNVLLVFEGAKIIDFGISRIEGASPSSSHFYGADGFISPEHVSLVPDYKNDVFVAATILAYAGTGKIPWKAGSPPRFYDKSIAQDQPDYTGLNKNQQTLLKTMHYKKLQDRASVDQSLELLASLTASQPAPTPPAPKIVKTARVSTSERLPKQAAFTPRQSGAPMTVGEFLNKNKGLIALGFFTGGWGLLAYWLWRAWKRFEPRSQPFVMTNVIKLIISGVLSFFSFGLLLFASLMYWGRKLKSKKLFRLGLASILLNVPTFALTAKNSEGNTSSFGGFWLMGMWVLVIYAHFHIFKLIRKGSDEPPTSKKVEPVNSKAKAAELTVEPEVPVINPELSDSNMTTGDSSWSSIESAIFNYLASRKGKQFTVEVLSNKYTGIYFQGYSEPGGYITVEAASNVSVNPPLEIENRKGLIKIGWEPPSDGLPNFIKFLDLKESENSEIAKLFVETLRDGYLLELGTFKVEV